MVDSRLKVIFDSINELPAGSTNLLQLVESAPSLFAPTLQYKIYLNPHLKTILKPNFFIYCH